MGKVRALSDAVVARHTGMPNLAALDADIEATPATEMYVVIYPDAGDAYQVAHGDTASGLVWGVTYVCVGRDRGQVATCVDLIRARNRGWTPDPNGNATWVEQPTGSRILFDGPPTDRRASLTLRYQLNTRS